MYVYREKKGSACVRSSAGCVERKTRKKERNKKTGKRVGVVGIGLRFYDGLDGKVENGCCCCLIGSWIKQNEIAIRFASAFSMCWSVPK